MNVWDVVIIALVVLALGFAVYKAVKSRGKCSCGCEGCTCECGKKKEKK